MRDEGGSNNHSGSTTQSRSSGRDSGGYEQNALSDYVDNGSEDWHGMDDEPGLGTYLSRTSNTADREATEEFEAMQDREATEECELTQEHKVSLGLGVRDLADDTIQIEIETDGDDYATDEIEIDENGDDNDDAQSNVSSRPSEYPSGKEQHQQASFFGLGSGGEFEIHEDEEVVRA